MNDMKNLTEDEGAHEEEEHHTVSLEDIKEDLDDILFSMHDLEEKIALYQTQNQVSEDVLTLLKKIADFCAHHKDLSGLLEEVL